MGHDGAGVAGCERVCGRLAQLWGLYQIRGGSFSYVDEKVYTSLCEAHFFEKWIFLFALACAASSLYGWLAGTWPFSVVEGIWATVALRRWWLTHAGKTERGR